MPRCPKCGSEVDEKMVFCPKCGAPLRMEQPADRRDDWRTKRRKWREQRREQRRQRRQAEKSEKAEKWEKTEKHERMFLGPLIGGLVLIIFGASLYFSIVGGFDAQLLGALFLVFVGVIIIVAALHFIVVAERRHPRP
ncbi:MAG: zinc ribbon domain-containing protein [Candidatus Bathyarchaeia archaeon]